MTTIHSPQARTRTHRFSRGAGRIAAGVATALLAGALSSCQPKGPASAPATQPARLIGYTWTGLFDGKTLAGWKQPEWGDDGKVYVKDGVVHMKQGATCTGITCTGKVPRDDFEIELDAMRVDGQDFFCGLTFPVGKGAATLILGGWGGSLVGLSCINGYDASQNQTTQMIEFKNGRWYNVRVRVTKEKVVCWLDDKEIISTDRKDHKFSVRWEVEPSQPLGIATWMTHGAARDLRIRLVPRID